MDTRTVRGNWTPVNVISFKPKLTRAKEIVSGDGYEAAFVQCT